MSRNIDFEEFFDHHLLVTKNLRELKEIEAQMQTETWTVITKMDTFILKHWVDEASKYQAELMTDERAIAPEPIKLTTDACFSTPMLSMGRRRVTGVKWLREVARGAPKTNKPRIEYIIELYEKGEIANLKTAENIIERLASKAARKIYTDKTDRIYNKLVESASDRKAFDVATGVRKAELELKNVMVTMILYREKEADPKKEKQKEDEVGEIPVHIDFEKGTSAADAKIITKHIIKLGENIEKDAQATVVTTGRGRNYKKTITPSKDKHLKNLKQFYIGQFELKVDETDLKWLKDEVEDQMLIRNDELTRKTFYETTKFLSKHNVVFAHLMDTTGDSYLAGLYLMKIQDSKNPGNTAFIPKKDKNKDTEKLAAFYRFTTTE